MSSDAQPICFRTRNWLLFALVSDQEQTERVGTSGSRYRMLQNRVKPTVNTLSQQSFWQKASKVEMNPRTGHEGPQKERNYSSTLSLTSMLDGGWVVNATPRMCYPPGKGPGTHCTGGRVTPRVDVDVCRESRPASNGIRSPEIPAGSELLYRLSSGSRTRIFKIGYNLEPVPTSFLFEIKFPTHFDIITYFRSARR